MDAIKIEADRIIPRTLPLWQRELAEGVTSLEELLALLELPSAAVGVPVEAEAAVRSFPLRVPRGFVARMKKGDPKDPLLLQILPRGLEEKTVEGFDRDPVGEVEGGRPLPGGGILHKYRGRLLLVLTGACAVHCRYCFRRHFPYGEENPGWGGWQRAVDYLAADSSLKEVILSGGDPLSASDRRLGSLAQALAAVPHLESLRIHTRLPVVLPSRVDEGLLEWLQDPTVARLRRVVVLHANHPAEVDADVVAACTRLREAGVTLLNQAVLLAGVNDSAAVLYRLGEKLFDAGVAPYYLHLLDPVAGSAHFEVAEQQARRIYGELLAQAPGYLVPRLVREVAGAAAKVPVGLAAEELV